MKYLRVPSTGGTSARRHYLDDLVGTITTALTNAGAVADTSVKNPWGNQVAGSTGESHGALAQRQKDNESGLVFMRARMYDPARGRWTQHDPVRRQRHMEHYLYAGNAPTGRTDPFGDRWKVANRSARTEGMLRDLTRCTVLQIRVDGNQNAWFLGDQRQGDLSSPHISRELLTSKELLTANPPRQSVKVRYRL